ncbi:hypothetical protein HMPREF9554_01132 [Treponema phagedenis F0421]|nr:hypothetical protein HMPREF9554_01132 [Treponema phagedenis F0421]
MLSFAKNIIIKKSPTRRNGELLEFLPLVRLRVLSGYAGIQAKHRLEFSNGGQFTTVMLNRKPSLLILRTASRELITKQYTGIF